MMKYLVATHGELAAGIINSVSLIIGNGENVDYFSMTKSKSSEDAEMEIKNYLERNKGESLIVLTDLFGGSVANAFTKYLLEGYQFELVTGVNLPMLLTMLLSDQESKEQIVCNGIEEGSKGIIHINKILEQQGGNRDGFITIED